MSIVNTTLDRLLVDDLVYIEYVRVDKYKPWLGSKMIMEKKLPKSIITRSGINTNSKGNEQEAGSTQAQVVTAVNYKFKVGAIIRDNYRNEVYTIVNVRKNHNIDNMNFYAYRLGLEWISNVSEN